MCNELSLCRPTSLTTLRITLLHDLETIGFRSRLILLRPDSIANTVTPYRNAVRTENFNRGVVVMESA